MREKKKSRTVVQKGFFFCQKREEILKRETERQKERQKMLLQFQIDTQKSEAAAKVRIFNNLLDYLLYLLDILGGAAAAAGVVQQKKSKEPTTTQYELAKKAFEALPGVQSVRARAENDAQNVLLPFYFINFVRILPFKGRKSAFLLGRGLFLGCSLFER